MAVIKDIEPMREQAKAWIEEYKIGALKHNHTKFVNNLTRLTICIEFSKSSKSIEMMQHFYKLRNEIQVHYINKNYFNNRYKKLNEKITYHIEKMINQIWQIDYMVDNEHNRLHCFKSDVKHYANELNNGEIS